jgi:hypothetical protein
MQIDLVDRANCTTHWSAAAWKPAHFARLRQGGTGGFAPISARPVLSVPPLRPAPVHLILSQIHLVIMALYFLKALYTSADDAVSAGQPCGFGVLS